MNDVDLIGVCLDEMIRAREELNVQINHVQIMSRREPPEMLDAAMAHIVGRLDAACIAYRQHQEISCVP